MTPDQELNVSMWVAALRDPNRKQAQGRLRKGDGMCCLGVLCDIEDPEEWVDEGGVWRWSTCEAAPPAGLAMMRCGMTDRAGALNYPFNEVTLAVMKRIGEKLDRLGSCLAQLNDKGATFAEIADIIESRPPGLFS